MDQTTPATDSSTLSLPRFLSGVASIAWRIPSIIKPFKTILSFQNDDPVSMGTVLEDNARLYGDRPALLYEDRVISHREFNDIVNRYAHFLISKGARKGDRAMVLVDNRPELLIIIGAISKIGAISALINPNQRGEVLLHSINITRGKLFIVGEELLEAFEEVKSDLRLQTDDVLLFQKENENTAVPDGYLDLDAEIRNQPTSTPDTLAAVRLGDAFAYVFTSGTTGLPKASVQTHRRWFSGRYWFGRIVMNLKPDDVYYCTLPFCHTNGLHVAWGACAGSGTAMAFRRKFSASRFWEDTRKYNANSFIYIGEICRYLMNQPEQPDDRNNPVQKIVGNGLRPEIWMTFKKRFGIRYVYELYGAAEAPLIFTNILNLNKTVGLCLTPFTIVEYDIDADAPILGDDGFMKKVAKGGTGLLLAKISETMPFVGYTDKSQTDSKIYRDVYEKGDTWFNSGDLVYNMGFRHVRFVDRMGDTFRWKGENVSTGEVEKVVNSFAQVSQSTAYGVQIQGTEGRAGMVSIIPFSEPGEFDLKGFVEMVRKALPAYAVPRFLRFKTEFETTGTHKIKKALIRNEGFDVGAISDPMFVLLPGEEGYQPLTPELHAAILAGEYRF